MVGGRAGLRRAAAVLAACFLGAGAALGQGAPPEPQRLIAPALIAALDRTVLAAELTARIAAMPARPGESFEEGAVLARADCATFEAQREASRAELEAAQAELAVKRRLFDLQSAGALEVELAEAELRRARAGVALRDIEVARCTLRAPYAGRVVEWLARPHATVAAGEPLLEIVGAGRLEVEIIVPAAWLAWLEPGHRFTFRDDATGALVPGVVATLGAAIDPASQTLVIRGRLDEPGAALPGLSGRALFDPPPGGGD